MVRDETHCHCGEGGVYRSHLEHVLYLHRLADRERARGNTLWAARLEQHSMRLEAGGQVCCGVCQAVRAGLEAVDVL